MIKHPKLIEVSKAHKPLQDVDGFVLPMKGGRFRLTEDYNVFDTGIEDAYPNPINNFLNYVPSKRQVGPRKMYERNTFIPLKYCAFNIPDLAPTPVNLVYLWALTQKPLVAPDSVLTVPNFKVKWLDETRLNAGELHKDDFAWTCNGKVTFTAFNGRVYRLTPTPIKAVIDDATGRFLSTETGSAMVEGTNRDSILFNCVGENNPKGEETRANAAAYSLGLSVLEDNKEFFFLDDDDTNVLAFNLKERPRKISDTSFANYNRDGDFTYDKTDPVPGPAPAQQGPKANFTFVADELEVTFTDTSVDPDGTVTAWKWNMGDGTEYNVQNPVHTYAAEGAYRVSLAVTDNTNMKSFNNTKDVIAKNNRKPIADFEFTNQYLEVTFTNTSNDLDGVVAGYQWDFGDGNTSTDENPVHTYASGGSYTISLVVTDDDGEPSASYQQVIAVVDNTKPTASFTVNANYLDITLSDRSTDVENTIVGWAWDFGDGNTSTLQNPTHSYAAAGTYNISLVATDQDGKSSDAAVSSISVVENTRPVASFNETIDHLVVQFQDTSTDIENSIGQWLWDFDDGQMPTATNAMQHPEYTYASSGTYTVTLTVVDQDGKTSVPSATKSITVTANVAPTASFTHVIDKTEVAFTDTSTDGDGTISEWLWDFGDGNVSTQQSPTYEYAASGTYNVSLVVTDDDGTQSTAATETITVAENVSPTAGFTYSADFLEVTFTSTATDTDGTIIATQYDFGDGNLSTQINPTHTYAAAGTYTVTQMVGDNNQDASNLFSETITVVANEKPVAAFSEVADHGEVTFTEASTDIDGTVASYAWDFGDGNASNVRHPVHTYTANGTYDVTLVVTDDKGLESDPVVRQVNVVLNNPPTVDFSFVVDKLEVDFTDTSTDGDGTISTYAWDFGDGNTSAVQSPTHTYASAGAYNVSLTVTDDDGTSSTPIIKSVTAIANVAPTANYNASVDKGKVTFTNLSADTDGTIASYAWNFGDGNTSTDINPVHTYAANGSYNVTLVVTDDDGEDSVAYQESFNITVNVLPTASFTSAKEFLKVTLTDTSSDGDGTVSAWDWDFGDGNTSNLQNPVHTYASAGTYTISLTVMDDDAATSASAATESVTVVANVPPTASFTKSVDNEQVDFTDTSTDGDGSVTEWLWNFGDGNTSNLQNPLHTYAAEDTYSVSLIVKDDQGVSSTVFNDSVTILFNVAPTASFTHSADYLDVTFTDTSTDTDGTITTYAWDFGDPASGASNTSSVQNPVHAFSSAGTYDVKLTVTDDDGQLSSQTTVQVTVEANTAPTASFTHVPSGPLGVAFTDTSTDDASGTVTSWAWDFDDGGATSTQQNPTHTFTASGTYNVSLTVTDDKGLTSVADVQAVVVA